MAESVAGSTPAESAGAGDGATPDAAVIDFLGLVAYGEVSAFERLVEDTKLAPTLEDKVAMATMAAGEFGKVARFQDRIRELGGDPYAAMAPFREAIDEFHRHTAPADWYEGLVKAFVGDGLADDFYRGVADYLDPQTRDLVIASTEEGEHARFVVERVRSATAADPTLSGRLALWGRRLMGEALTQAQRIAADRASLATLLLGSEERPGADLHALAAMFAGMTDRHTKRMAELGLDA